MPPTTSHVTISPRGPVWTLTLDRPEKRNALTRAMVHDLAAGLQALDDSPEGRVGVLTGRGPSFCAGMDLAEFGVRSAESDGSWQSVLGAVTRRSFSTPLVGAVEGHAVAGGLEILMAADVIVASRTATFALPEVRRGLVAAEGGLLALTRRLPVNEVRRLALTGSAMTADRAHQLGLVTELTEPGQTLAAALRIAEQIATAAPLAVAATREILEQSPGWADDEAWDRHDRIAERAIQSDDAREGALAFVERREPRWTGR